MGQSLWMGMCRCIAMRRTHVTPEAATLLGASVSALARLRTVIGAVALVLSIAQASACSSGGSGGGFGAGAGAGGNAGFGGSHAPRRGAAALGARSRSRTRSRDRSYTADFDDFAALVLGERDVHSVAHTRGRSDHLQVDRVRE